MFASHLWSRGGFREWDRLNLNALGQRESNSAHSAPALNAALSNEAVQVQLLVPGVDPASLEVLIEKSVLSIHGERAASVPGGSEPAVARSQERFSGKFRRALRLPQDVDSEDVKADYRDGVLHIRIGRKGPVPVRRVPVQ